MTITLTSSIRHKHRARACKSWPPTPTTKFPGLCSKAVPPWPSSHKDEHIAGIYTSRTHQHVGLSPGRIGESSMTGNGMYSRGLSSYYRTSSACASSSGLRSLFKVLFSVRIKGLESLFSSVGNAVAWKGQPQATCHEICLSRARVSLVSRRTFLASHEICLIIQVDSSIKGLATLVEGYVLHLCIAACCNAQDFRKLVSHISLD